MIVEEKYRTKTFRNIWPFISALLIIIGLTSCDNVRVRQDGTINFGTDMVYKMMYFESTDTVLVKKVEESLVSDVGKAPTMRLREEGRSIRYVWKNAFNREWHYDTINIIISRSDIYEDIENAGEEYECSTLGVGVMGYYGEDLISDDPTLNNVMKKKIKGLIKEHSIE